MTAAGTEMLIFPFYTPGAMGTDGEKRISTVYQRVKAKMNHLRCNSEGQLFFGCFNAQEIIGGFIKADAELFQGIDGRGGFPSGDGTEISWAEIA